jgi:DNA-binding NarL/FixJ family response regulator
MKPDLPEDPTDRVSAHPGVLDDPIRILIADDDEQTTLVLSESLPAFGFEVVGSAHSGAEAGDKVAALHPEVVLMDLRMPGVDGIEATVQIKAREPKTQVVILTAHPGERARDLAVFMGADDLIEKNAPL